VLEALGKFWNITGFAHISAGNVVMIVAGCVMMYLAIKKEYEPLLLLPLGFGAILANIPGSGLLDSAPGGMFRYFFDYAIMTDVAPILLFFGIGAMTDLGPLLARPSLMFISAAAQLGQFAALLVATLAGYGLKEAAAIGIIGGANGPVTVFMATRLAPEEMIGPIVVTAYLYMALVHLIQPPIMKLLTTQDERKIIMAQQRPVSKREKIIFIVAVTILASMLLPIGTPLFAFFMAGNLLRESGVTERLSLAAQNEITNIFIICLVFGISYTLSADKFLNLRTIGILGLGLLGFGVSTASGVLMAKLMKVIGRGDLNPLIGAAGLAAVPHSPRVVQQLGREANPSNYLIMHAMGPNMGAIIASSMVACVIYSLLV